MEPEKQKEENQIKEVFDKLPPMIQDAITKSGWQNVIRRIVDRYKLRVDQGTQLENMTLALMMGQMDAREYYDSIIKDFELGSDQAKSLFEDIDSEVFGNIEDIIIKLEEQQKKKEINEQIEMEKTGQAQVQNGAVPNKSTYMRDDVEGAAMEDEILTVTRDEILKGIEEEHEIDVNEPKPVSTTGNMTPPPVPTPNSTPAPSTDTQTAQQTPPPSSEPAPVQGNTIEPEKIDSSENNLADNVANQTKPPKPVDKKPVDPVEAGFSSNVSTSNKDYNSTDPYREPIE